MKRRTFCGGLAALTIALAAAPALAQTPLSPPVKLTVGYQKVGHLAPITLIEDELKKLGVELKLVEFARYADARTALLAGSLDVASVGPADLAIALAQGLDRHGRHHGRRRLAEIRHRPQGREARQLGRHQGQEDRASRRARPSGSSSPRR